MPTVQTNDIETYYVRQGGGPPVIFIHAMFMSSPMWEFQMDSLADAYTTIAYDVRGHGHTGGSEKTPYSVDLFADDLDALLDALNVDRTVICGLSMGGAIAQAFAGSYPEKVAGLIIADTFATGSLALAGRIAMANIRFLSRLDRLVNYKTLNQVQMWLGHRLVPGMSGDLETVQRLVDKAPTIPHRELVKIADATARFPKAKLDLSRVTAPTLILYGEHLPSGFEAWAEQLSEQLSNTDPTIRVVPGAGHASNIDNPEFFTEALREFLTGRVYSN